jgi:putative nucleotidyltransferase with HDIG domain
MTAAPERPQAPWAISLVPPFPAIAHRILALASQDNVGSREVGAVVRLDPSFSAEVLSFANSALFGARCRVSSLTQAVALLGMNRIKSMATFVAVNKMVRSSVRAAALRKVWIHSVVTAIIAEEAACISRQDREFAYTAGLLHNLGVLGLMSAYPDEYCRMVEVYSDFGFELLQTERDLFDIDHCEAGAYLAREWNFPDELAAAIASHHGEPEVGEPTNGNIIKLSWRLADTLGFAAFPSDKDWPFDDLVAYFPDAAHSWLCASAESAKQEIEARLADSPL